MNASNVGTVHKKIGGETMAKSVWCDMLGNTGEFGVLLNNAFNAARSETAIITGRIWNAFIFAVIEEEGRQVVVTGVEVVLDMFSSGAVDENWTVFAALTADHELFTFEIDLLAIQIAELADAEPTREEKLNNGAIAETGFGIFWDFVEKTIDFVDMKKSYLFSGSAR